MDPAKGDPPGESFGGDSEIAEQIDELTHEILSSADSAGLPSDTHGSDTHGSDTGEEDSAGLDVAAVLAERDEFRELAQRIQADFDNFRKRAVAQSLAEADRASGRLAAALLPVLDAAEAAYVRYPDEVGPLLNQMLAELKKHGLENLDLESQPFDPEVAEAVAHEPGEGGEPTVVEVLRSGYLWKGRVLRPAMVRTKD